MRWIIAVLLFLGLGSSAIGADRWIPEYDMRHPYQPPRPQHCYHVLVTYEQDVLQTLYDPWTGCYSQRIVTVIGQRIELRCRPCHRYHVLGE